VPEADLAKIDTDFKIDTIFQNGINLCRPSTIVARNLLARSIDLLIGYRNFDLIQDYWFDQLQVRDVDLKRKAAFFFNQVFLAWKYFIIVVKCLSIKIL